MTHTDSSFAPCPALKRVARGNLCAGCGGCALVAPEKIAMDMTPPGFLRPVQSQALSADEEARIAQICPGLGQKVDAAGRTDDVLWGPYVSMQMGWSTDPDLRYTASSGGGLSAVLTYLLDNKIVQGIIQTAASPKVPVANVAVLSEDAEAIKAAAGSRYAPSAPLANIEPYLDSDQQFAFVGKPCDVAALRALSLLDPRVDQRIPVMLSFFCAGVPSQTGAEEVLAKLGTDLDSTESFRYRGNGWPGFATAKLKDGSERAMSYFDSWGKTLSRHVQNRCRMCADGTGKAADIVCADAWETDEKGYPLFEEEDGISLIVARTSKGQSLLDQCISQQVLITRPFDIATLPDIQTGQRNRRHVLLARLIGLKAIGRPAPHYQGLHLMAAARRGKFKDSLKNFLGMIRRGLQGRLD